MDIPTKAVTDGSLRVASTAFGFPSWLFVASSQFNSYWALSLYKYLVPCPGLPQRPWVHVHVVVLACLAYHMQNVDNHAYAFNVLLLLRDESHPDAEV